MKLTTVALLAFSVVAARKERDVEKCVACYGLADHVAKRLADTEARANEEISIGVRLGADGETKPKTVVRYGDSDNRLLDILEGACDGNSKKARCHEVVHEQEDNIAAWFHDSRDSTFNKAICDAHINGCSAEVVAQHAKSDVEVDDDNGKPEVEKQKKTEGGRAKESKQAPKTGEKGATAPAFDPLAIVKKVVGRMKNNALRAKSLSIELFGELQQIARARNWAKLGGMLKDGKFYQKYYLVFVALFFVIYLLFSIYETLFGKAPAKTARPSRSTGTKRKTAKAKKDE